MIRASALAVLLLAAACTHPPEAPVTTKPTTTGQGSGSPIQPMGGGPHAPVVVAPVASPIVKPGDAKHTVIEAPHAARIRALAATPDAGAALTVDDADDMRLWPTLDGSAEPRVVELPRPKFLALGRDPGDAKKFVAAIVDDVGGLTIAKVDADGRVGQRAVIESELAFTGIAMTSAGPLGWRNDQTIVQLDAGGTATAVLPVEAGEHLVTVAVTGDRAVAVLETANDQDTHRHARVITVVPGGKLAWGARLTVKDDVSRIVAISPNGKRIATTMLDPKTGAHLLVFDVDTKTLIANQPDRGAQGIAFADDDHVALVTDQAIVFAEVNPQKAPPATTDFTATIPLAPITFGAGGGHIVTPRNDELAIAEPAKTEYLGYGLQSPNVAAEGNGQLLVGLGDQFAVLDRDLHQVAAPGPDQLALTGSTVQEVHWLGGSSWLVESTSANDGKTTIALVDLAAKTRREMRGSLPVAPILMFEPTTNILTLSLGDAPEALKFDPAKQSLDKLMVLPKPNGFEQRELVPVAPSLAGGTQLVSVQMRDTTTLSWSKSTAKLDAAPAVTLDGTLAATDRAGDVWMWINGADKKLVLAGFANGKQFGTLATEGPTTVWPDPKGERIVEIASTTLALVKRDGTKLWSLPVTAASEAHWLDDNTIAMISALGLARIDATTGKIGATRCGWRFGLSKTPHPFMQRGEPLCTAPTD